MYLICRNRKNYALTVDTVVYEATRITRNNYVRLRNDNGVLAEYSMNLFEEIPHREIQPPTPQLFSLSEIINSVSLLATTNRLSVSLADGVEFISESQIFTSDSEISCGIGQGYNIATFVDEIINELPTAIRNLIPSRTIYEQFNVSVENLLSSILEQYFCLLIGRLSWSMLLVSNNNLNDEFMEVFPEAMSEIAIETPAHHNPSSGNQIILWIISNELINNG